jgi:excisionase family DNA binding protein
MSGLTLTLPEVLLDRLRATIREAIQTELGRTPQPVGWLDVDAAATYLSTTPSAIRARIRRGELPFHKLGGSILFKPDEIDARVRGEA